MDTDTLYKALDLAIRDIDCDLCPIRDICDDNPHKGACDKLPDYYVSKAMDDKGGR